MEKYVVGRHFDSDDKRNAIISPLFDCHGPGRTVSLEPNMHSSSFNNAERFKSMSLSKHSTLNKNKKTDKINSLLTRAFSRNEP